MPWIVYETRNLINGKVYVGVHRQSDSQFDGYLGSGREITAAISQFGSQSFVRRTIAECDTEADAFAKEAEIVTEEWCRSDGNYNVRAGCGGGRAPAKVAKEACRATERLRAKAREWWALHAS